MNNMEFTDLLDEYLELKQLYDNGHLSECKRARFYEVKHEINARIRGEL